MRKIFGDIKMKLFNNKRVWENIEIIITKSPAFIFYIWLAYALVLAATTRSPPARLYNGRIVDEHIIRGHEMTVHFDVDRYRYCDITYKQTLYDVNGTRHFLPDFNTIGYRPPGLNSFAALAVAISSDFPKGPAIYKSSRKYICNWTQEIAPIYVADDDINFNVE